MPDVPDSRWPAGSPRPSFLVIGATKCGTTSLHRYLTAHPQVFVHPWKELRFFSAEHRWKRGLDWYRSQFAAAGGARAIGESSNSYTRHPVYRGVPERIHRILPDVRLVYLVRHPVEQLASHYRHRLASGVEWRGPEDALRADPSYLAGCLYGHQLEQYLRRFRPEQILTLRLERLASAPGASLGRLCAFLGVDEMPGLDFPLQNPSAERAPAPRLLRRLAGLPGARKRVKATVRWLRRRGLDRYRRPAQEVAFALGPRCRAELVARVRRDAALLSRLLGEPFDDWDLEAPLAGGERP